MQSAVLLTPDNGERHINTFLSQNAVESMKSLAPRSCELLNCDQILSHVANQNHVAFIDSLIIIY